MAGFDSAFTLDPHAIEKRIAAGCLWIGYDAFFAMNFKDRHALALFWRSLSRDVSDYYRICYAIAIQRPPRRWDPGPAYYGRKSLVINVLDGVMRNQDQVVLIRHGSDPCQSAMRPSDHSCPSSDRPIADRHDSNAAGNLHSAGVSVVFSSRRYFSIKRYSARRLMPSARAACTLLPFTCCKTSRT